MSDATAAVDRKRKDGVLLDVQIAKYSECASIFKGQIVGREAAGGTSPGFAYHLGDDAGAYFTGIAYETVAQASTDTTDGDNTVRVWRKGIFVVDYADGASAGSATVLLCGQVMYAVDSSTVDLGGQTTNDIAVGLCVAVESASGKTIWVDINGYC